MRIQNLIKYISERIGKEIEVYNDVKDKSAGFERIDNSIGINLARFKKYKGKDLIRRVVSVIMHEDFGHSEKLKLVRCSEAAYRILSIRYDEAKWTHEISPVHIQCALMGDDESIEILKESGYFDLFEKYLKVYKRALIVYG